MKTARFPIFTKISPKTPVTEILQDMTIRNYVIPVVQERPSAPATRT